MGGIMTDDTVTVPTTTETTTTGKTEILRSGCFFCHCRCGVLVHKVDGRVVKVEGDPDNPHNKGFVCARIAQERYLEGYLYNPNRLKRPLKRAGERGSGQWEEISWEQALDEIAEKLAAIRDEYGAEAVSFTEAPIAPGTPCTISLPTFFARLTMAATAPSASAATCGWSPAPMAASAATRATGQTPT